MDEKKGGFPKSERLSRKYLIDLLFEQGRSFIVYPLRLLFLPLSHNEMSAPTVLISVPKRRVKHAVDRNLIKRQIREAYRLQKTTLMASVTEKKESLLVAFLYVGEGSRISSESLSKAMERALMRLSGVVDTVRADARTVKESSTDE